MSNAEATRWNAPSFGTRTSASVNAPVKVGPSVEEIAAIEAEARAEGLAEGRKEGFATGQAEVQRLQNQLGQMLRLLSQPMSEFDQEVAEALGQVAVQIAGVLLREAYEVDPSRLERLVDTALNTIADQRLGAEVHLHPQDFDLLNQDVDRGKTRLVPDPSLQRGDLRVHTPILRIDGTLQARLQEAFADLDLSETASP